MNSRFDFAQAYYWRIEFVEPQNPDDDRYVLLHGDEGEIVGPLTMSLAEAWIAHFRTLRQSDASPAFSPRAGTPDA